jgi:dihydrofolate synthase/folylpolyglutamate synthase
MLEAAGDRVHVYTSPHLVRFNERIRLAGRLIEDTALAPLLAEVLDAAEAEVIGPSFFEATTAAALLAFSRTPADACVIEVGLGGRLDATNIIPHPTVCGIAQLGVDHESFLGGDPVTIAGEKAGIAKAGVPLVTLDYPPAQTARIAAVAEAAGSPVCARGAGWSLNAEGGALCYTDASGRLSLPCPALAGAHQIENASLAVAMLRHQQMLTVSLQAMRRGISQARWPARLQRLAPGPLVTAGQDVWLDGCHNPAGAMLIAEHFDDRQPITLICGILANKDALGILRPFRHIARRVIAIPIIGHACHPPLALAGLCENLAIPASTATNIRMALTSCTGDRILVMGSLYLASEVLNLNEEWPD